jgi:hypothetical protein
LGGTPEGERAHNARCRAARCGGFDNTSAGVPLSFSCFFNFLLELPYRSPQSRTPPRQILSDRGGKQIFVPLAHASDANRIARIMKYVRPRDSGGGGPPQRVRPEVAGPMTSSGWWRGRVTRSLSCAANEAVSATPLPPHFMRSPIPVCTGRDGEATVSPQATPGEYPGAYDNVHAHRAGKRL